METSLGWNETSEAVSSKQGDSGSGSGLVGSSNTSVLRSDDPSLMEYLQQEPVVPPNPFSAQLWHQRVPAFPEAAPLVGSMPPTRLHDRARFDDVGLESEDNDFAVGCLPLLRGLIIAVLVGALVLTLASVRGMVNDWNGALDHEESTPDFAHLPALAADEVEVVHAPLGDVPAHTAAATKGLHAASVWNFSRTTAKSDSRSEKSRGAARTSASTRTANIPVLTADTTADVIDDVETLAYPERHSRRTMWRRECAHYFYTYCESVRQEWYYKPMAHSCVATTSDPVHVCNRGVNRFSSLGSCFASCVHGNRNEEQCFEAALFTACQREDVTSTWWFFDGHRCIRWNFPLGSCPSEQSRVFHSREQCERECRRTGRNRTASVGSSNVGPGCEAPVSATCSPRQIRYPYFADMRAKGSARCVRVSASHLLTHRCLVGSNRFSSLATCSRFCVEPMEPVK